MSANIGIWVVIIGFFAVIIGVGIIVGRKEKAQSVEDYFVSGRGLSSLAVAATIMGTALASGVFVGLPSMVFSAGYAGIVCVPFIGGNIGVMFNVLLNGKPTRTISEKFNAVTIGDMLAGMYKTNVVKYIAAPTILIASILFCLVEWQSLGTLLYILLGITYKQGVIIGVVVVALYTVVSGNTSNSFVSIVQMFVAVFAAVYVVFLTYHLGGGVTNLNESLASIDPQLLQGTNNVITPLMAFGFGSLYCVGSLGQPSTVSKFATIGSHRMWPKVLLLSTIGTLLINYVPLCGLFMRFKYETGGLSEAVASTLSANPDTTMSYFITLYNNPYIGGVIVAASMAAIMSTVASLLLLCASTAVSDVCGGMFRMKLDGKKGMTVSRITLLACAAISALLALNPSQTVLQMTTIAWGVFAAVFLPSMCLGMRWRRATKPAAIASMLYSLILLVTCQISTIAGHPIWPFKIDVGAFTMWSSLALFIIVSLLTPAEDKSHFMPPKKKDLKRRIAAASVENA